ncbi:hypothetical protein CcI49_02950 [Frankia sp. CcI49]|uniref:hypothetical protein n=1 Tax=Frankia sp. CcI49 TaxID=1745382 RepID=UPI000976CA35|nr:hypothetical protein [Frankia sp. CcI49]ONH62353.1 hypothetical protein CcI49_02950 [Frankia sp. CcI49]
MDLATLRSTASSIEDPVERTRFLLRVIDEQQGFITEAARLRRLAILEAREAGLTQEEIARALGLTAGRVSQMAKGVNYVVTGWFAPEVAIEPTVSIIGSRSSTTDDEVVTATVRALGELLTRRRLRVTHGPAGVGIEALTYVADHHRPPELGSVTGVFGHPNVVKGSEYVLVVGGGQGTEEEVRIASSLGKKILPMATSGGAASAAFVAMLDDPVRRAWIGDERFAALSSAGPAEYARLVDELLPAQPLHGGQPS